LIEKKMKNEDEISKLIKAFPKDIAAVDEQERKRSKLRLDPDGELFIYAFCPSFPFEKDKKRRT
jgi:hypothetical protein